MSNHIFTETHKGYVAAALAAIFYGSSGLFVKLAQNTGLGSLDLLIVQHLVAVPILWVIVLIKYYNQIKVSKQTLGKLFFMGAFLSSTVNLLYYQSFKYLNISIATIILYTYPIMIALFSFIFLRQKPSKIIVFSLFTAFIGCIMVLNLFNTNLIVSTAGILYSIGAACIYAVLSIFMESIDNKVHPFVYISYSSSFALLGFMLYRPPVHLLQTGLNGTQIGIAALLAFICQIPPNTLIYVAIRHIGAVKTSVVANIEIPTTAILGYVFFRETLNLSQLLGMLLVVGGILFMKNGEFFISAIKSRFQFIRKYQK